MINALRIGALKSLKTRKLKRKQFLLKVVQHQLSTKPTDKKGRIPMKQFDARARAEEAIFANRCKQDFLLDARGLRRLAEWAAEKIHDGGTIDSADYADTLIRTRLEGRDPIQSVVEDFKNAGLEANDRVISWRLERYVREASKAA